MPEESLLDTGERDLPAVVCLHSLFLDATSFDAFVEAGRGHFRFLRPTFPGQGGRTDEATATVTMDDCVKDVVSSLAAAGVESYVRQIAPPSPPSCAMRPAVSSSARTPATCWARSLRRPWS